MIAVLWAILGIVIGCALVYRFGRLRELAPGWAAALLIFGAGAAAGIGVTSCLFFVCRLAAPSTPKLSLFVEAAILAWLAYEIWLKRDSAPARAATSQSPFTPLLMAAVLVALAVITGAMAGAWDANPQGGWDAWSIWNLRARFLAAPGVLYQRAWSSALSWTHPEYPLLLSGFIARCWSYAGSSTDAPPIAVGYIFLLALLTMLIGGLAVWRSSALGLLAGAILLGSPSVLHEATTQYADIPLACYFTGAMIFILLDRPWIAGLFAGFAAWTKDEGALFLVVFLAAVAIFRRARILQTAAAALPGALLFVAFKFALALRASTFFGQGLTARLFDPARIGQVLSAFLREFSAMGVQWYHPILPVLALAAALRLDRARRGDLSFTAAVPLSMLAGYFVIFLITPFDLAWQLQTSLYRLLVQVWPLFLIAAFAILRTPESAAIQATQPAANARRKSRGRHA
jgi:hypothetical protein